MPTTFSQDNRIGQMITPLPMNTLVLTEFSGTERVNGINEFRVRALSALPMSQIEPLLGEAMSVEIATELGGTRVFHQMVDQLRYLGRSDDAHLYEFELRPWFWLLSRRINSRIFHDVSIIDIVHQITAEYAASTMVSVSDLTSGSSPMRSYVVQYNESDLNFLRRLLEQYGINFHFSMSRSGHALVLTSAADAFTEAPGPARSYSPLGNRGDQTIEHFVEWLPQRQLTTGAVKLMDFNYNQPNANMESRKEAPLGANGADLESYRFPGGYALKDGGDMLAQWQLNAHRSLNATVRAQGNACSLGAGMKFNLGAHDDSGQLGEYAVLEAQHFVSNGSFRSGGAGGATYSGSYTFSRSSNPLSPPLATPQPSIVGPQTAIVADGADGQLDDQGRITVKFHWAPNDVSLRCRVKQIWAGDSWGTIFIPHTGMEVVVEFIAGDPDRPIITGCVWNAVNNGPTFPENKLVSGFKTVRDNRLLFIDTEGSEQIQIRAQHDMLRVVMNDDKATVHGKQTNQIDGSKSETINGGSSISVGGDETHKVTGTLTIESKQKIELKVGSSSITIDQSSVKIKAMSVSVEASTDLTTKGGLTATHDGGTNMIIKAAMVMIN